MKHRDTDTDRQMSMNGRGWTEGQRNTHARTHERPHTGRQAGRHLSTHRVILPAPKVGCKREDTVCPMVLPSVSHFSSLQSYHWTHLNIPQQWTSSWMNESCCFHSCIKKKENETNSKQTCLPEPPYLTHLPLISLCSAGATNILTGTSVFPPDPRHPSPSTLPRRSWMPAALPINPCPTPRPGASVVTSRTLVTQHRLCPLSLSSGPLPSLAQNLHKRHGSAQ